MVEEEKPYAEEDVDDGGDEWEVQQQAGEVLHAWTFLADQVDNEEAQLEGEGEEHDKQVAEGEELIPTCHEAEIGQVVGSDIRQGQDPIDHNVGAFHNPRPQLLESRFRAAASLSLRPIIGGA